MLFWFTWLFGQFDIWYQPVIGVLIAIGLAICPGFISEKIGDYIMSIKQMMNRIY